MSLRTATMFLMALIRSNPSLKRLAIGGVKLERLYLTSERWNWQGKSLRRYIVYMHQLAIAIINLHLPAPIKISVAYEL